MTNLIFVLTLATNWTGHFVGTNELGYVVTNHTAHVVYQHVQYKFHLTNDLSDKAVWRPAQNLYLTNNLTIESPWKWSVPWNGQGLLFTNKNYFLK